MNREIFSVENRKSLFAPLASADEADDKEPKDYPDNEYDGKAGVDQCIAYDKGLFHKIISLPALGSLPSRAPSAQRFR